MIKKEDVPILTHPLFSFKKLRNRDFFVNFVRNIIERINV